LFVFLPDTYLSGELAETLEIFADFFSCGFLRLKFTMLAQALLSY
jgi:hypothetical protein